MFNNHFEVDRLICRRTQNIMPTGCKKVMLDVELYRTPSGWMYVRVRGTNLQIQLTTDGFVFIAKAEKLTIKQAQALAAGRFYGGFRLDHGGRQYYAGNATSKFYFSARVVNSLLERHFLRRTAAADYLEAVPVEKP